MLVIYIYIFIGKHKKKKIKKKMKLKLIKFEFLNLQQIVIHFKLIIFLQFLFLPIKI